jgi:hypothetical protein
MAHAGGRPTLYKPEYCQYLLEDMAQGFSLTAFAGLIGVSRSTINMWMDAHPEFSEAVSQGKALQLRAWELDARNIARGNGGPGASTMTVFGLSNLGDGEWRNKQDHTLANPDGSNLENRTVIILPPNGRD